LSVMEDAYIQEEQLDDLHSIMEMWNCCYCKYIRLWLKVM
jgi:hypothetical protein